MSDDLKARLRLWSRDPSVRDATHDCHEAADALDARDAEIARLRDALREIEHYGHHDDCDLRPHKFLSGECTCAEEIARTALTDHPTAGGQDQDQARIERAWTQLVYSLADHFALEVTDAQARSIAREVLQAADASDHEPHRPDAGGQDANKKGPANA